ncbi:hypothetical protein ACE6ED_14830 [Paenibacillus sp. CN-4]
MNYSNGEIVEQGTFAELMSRRQFFYNLYNVYKPEPAEAVVVTA